MPRVCRPTARSSWVSAAPRRAARRSSGTLRIKCGALPTSWRAALTGWSLQIATAVSADGRTVVGYGTDPSGNTQAWLAYLSDQVFWYPNTSGAWDTGINWTGLFPGPADAVVIDPTAAVTVTGPIANLTVNTLQLGGSGVARATLRLESATGGDLNVVVPSRKTARSDRSAVSKASIRMLRTRIPPCKNS